jgi:4-hydroxy-tetrahydrodipicolinate reductase
MTAHRTDSGGDSMSATEAIASSAGMPPVGVAIFGITGRMGQTLLRALREAPSGVPAAPAGVDRASLRLVGALASSGSKRLGTDAAAEGAATGVTVTADPAVALQNAAVAVDFSLPQCVAANARACAAARVPLLLGTTGFDGAALGALQAAAATIPVLVAPNTSVGVNVVSRLVKLATQALGAGYDVEISEAHHRMKRDAPSGTALALGELVAQARGVELRNVAVFDRHGSSEPRRDGDIGFAVLRAGDIVGEHTVTFATAGERVEITHRASDRITFARGALRAALWLAGRPPGLYSMDDVLGWDQA